MATKIGLYNAALREIGETKLASLTEARGPRYTLDDIYDEALAYCLEQGQWNFATRAVQVDADASIDPQFGYSNAFEKPSDWVRTSAISADDMFSFPLNDYEDETAYWHAHIDPIYVRYVSNGASYGLDLTAWPATFTRYVELYLAMRICKPTADSESMLDRIRKEAKIALIDARSKDGMNERVRFLPQGSWSAARGGRASRKYNRA